MPTERSTPTGLGPARREPDALPRDPRRVLTAIGAVVYDWDIGSDALGWSGNAADVMALPDLSALTCGRDFALLVEPTAGATRADAIAAATEQDAGSGVPYAASYGLKLAGGRLAIVDDTGRWFADAGGKPAHAHGVMRLRRADAGESETSLARSVFLGQVAADLLEIADSKRALTLLVIALPDLSDLNDALGFEEADAVVEAVLARLQATMRQRDRFARLGGNRFALLLRGCTAEQAAGAADRLLRLVTSDRIGTRQGPVEARIAIGAATAPVHAGDAGTLLRRAEASLSLAKRRAGSPVTMYDPALFRQRGSRREPLLDCIEILNARRIRLACQPVVESGSRQVAFSEALLRIEGEDGRIAMAGDVVPSLERAGLIHLADARMLELAADHLLLDPEARVSVNVSAMTLERPDWLVTLSGHLGARPGIASRLIVEITETAAIRDPAATRRILDTMKALGVAVAIDDFGSGHTSFRSLRNFPVDLVKIDGAFVQNLPRSPDDRFFVRTLVDLAQHLGITTVAEWVEDEESARLLASWGVDFLQGDHCGRPQLVAAREEPARRVA